MHMRMGSFHDRLKNSAGQIVILTSNNELWRKKQAKYIRLLSKTSHSVRTTQSYSVSAAPCSRIQPGRSANKQKRCIWEIHG